MKLVNFFSYGIVLFLCEDPFSLSNEWKGWGDVELMHHDIWIDLGHVLMAPRKDVQVVP